MSEDNKTGEVFYKYQNQISDLRNEITILETQFAQDQMRIKLMKKEDARLCGEVDKLTATIAQYEKEQPHIDEMFKRVVELATTNESLGFALLKAREAFNIIAVELLESRIEEMKAVAQKALSEINQVLDRGKK